MTGMRSRVVKMEKKIPPMTTITKGRWISEPIPREKSRGNKPIIVVNLVINTGLSRRATLSRRAESKSASSAVFLLKKVMRIRVFSKAMPNNAINPMVEGTERYAPAM